MPIAVRSFRLPIVLYLWMGQLVYPLDESVRHRNRRNLRSQSDDHLVGSVSIIISKRDLDEVGRKRLG
jgi:hypothetical protein